MLESLLPALQGLLTTAKAMASFDALRKGRKGDIRALIEELKENTRLNKSGFNVNALKPAKERAITCIQR